MITTCINSRCFKNESPNKTASKPMSFLSRIIPPKLHRLVENALGIEKDCLKEQISQLRALKYTDKQIVGICKGAVEWMQLFAPKEPFPVVLQLYISCLKNPITSGTEKV